MRGFEAIFERKVEDFLALYPTYIEQVRPELNGLFRQEDYPSVEKLRTKFSLIGRRGMVVEKFSHFLN
jgi:hypothetical protein